MDGMRSLFLRFFESRGHAVFEPYPVVARWRDDIYLTIASIAVFQPHVTSGQVPPPANPLVISQPCIRLNDLDSVGRTGRHLSEFEMMAHHAFNDDSEIYWVEETVQYCHDLLRSLGVSDQEVVYKVNPWAGGGNAGEALEVIVGGLEIATLVFMHYVEDPNGDVMIRGRRYSMIDLRIVDTGYGLERFVWASSGEPTIYDAVHTDSIDLVLRSSGMRRPNETLLRKWVMLNALEKKDPFGEMESDGASEDEIEQLRLMEKVYALVDHSRCLAFMLGDGIVPSNTKAGYLARLMVRRAERHRQRIGCDLALSEIVSKHIERYLPAYEEKMERISDVIDLEVSRFKNAMEKGRRLVERRISGEMGVEELIEMYDTYGVHPDFIREIAAEKGIEITVPEDFTALVAERHLKAQVADASETPKYPPTRKLYYEKPGQEFESEVLGVDDRGIVLSATQFYPEGGGQPPDQGVMMHDGRSYPVIDVQEVGGVVFHVIEAESYLRPGDRVKCTVDWKRRTAHARHHTATHLIIGAARRLLGDHVWQAGSHLGVDGGRIDITHYKPLTDQDVEAIEELVNRQIMSMIPVDVLYLDRNDADRRFGLRLYQGGAPASPIIRVIRIGDFEAEACGGTHCSNTGEIGMVLITSTERVQDGVERINFVAGSSALRWVRSLQKTVETASSSLRVQPSELPSTAERFFLEWKEQKKRLDEMGARIADILLGRGVKRLDLTSATVVTLSADDRIAVEIAKSLARYEGRLCAVISTSRGRLFVARTKDLDLNAVEAASAGAEVLGGSAGGSPGVAQGGGPHQDRMDEAISAAIRKIQADLCGDEGDK